VSDVLARRYRAVLHAYPRSHRSRRGEELLGTLLDNASPEQRWPSAREAASIVVEGLRVRVDASGQRMPRAIWLDGLHLAVVLLLAWAHAQVVGEVMWRNAHPRAGLAMLLLALLSIVAVLRGRNVAALLLAAAWLAVQVRFGALSWHLLTAVTVLALLTVWLRPMRQVRPAWWLLAVPLVLAARNGPELFAGGPVYLYPYLQVTIAAPAIVCAAGALLDPRLPIVAACVLAAETMQATVTGPTLADSESSGIVIHLAAKTLQATVTPAPGDTALSGVFLFVDPSWWTLILTTAASLLFLIGHFTIRHRVRL
jgi:hypothetical protein